MVSRRSFLIGLGSGLVAAPAIVRAASIMPVKVIEPIVPMVPEEFFGSLSTCGVVDGRLVRMTLPVVSMRTGDEFSLIVGDQVVELLRHRGGVAEVIQAQACAWRLEPPANSLAKHHGS